MPIETVRTTYLEQTSPADLRRAKPARDVVVVRAEIPCPEFGRFLYTAVGGDWYWTERLSWTRADWQAWMARPGSETWAGWRSGTPIGYFELDAQAAGAVEIAYFGLLGQFIGAGLGGHLLGEAVARAWDLPDRWPGREPTRRVWVHTCTLDGPHALRNYLARGFRPYRETEHVEEVPRRRAAW